MHIYLKLQRFFLLFVILAAPLRAQGDDHTGVREDCRKIIAGAYLAAYDRKEQASKLVQHLDSEIKINKIVLQVKAAAYEKLRKEAENKDFSVAKAEARNGAKSLVDTIRNQITESEVLMSRAKSQEEENKALAENLRKKIIKVFNIEALKLRKEGSYPFRIDYRSPCSKYRHTCPLVRQEAKDLLDIFVDDENPESCVKYAAMSGVSP